MPKQKVKKYRGSRTCGGGSHKNRRGAGNRGGRGRAGVHKHKYIKFVKLAERGLYQFGKSGFSRPKNKGTEANLRKLKSKLKELKKSGKLDEHTYKFLSTKSELNVGDLNRIIDKLVEFGLAKKSGGKYIVDLGEIGYSKLLGSGKVSTPMEIKVRSATSRATTKVESAGGVILTGADT